MTILDAIGKTPLVRLKVLPNKAGAEIWVKWESTNPTGSMKDRMARHMIEGAEARGELRPGMTVVEFTGGSTGSSLALVCAVKGYRAHFVTSDAIAREKVQTMRAFGAKVEVLPSEGGLITPQLLAQMQARVEELAARGDTFWTRQFSNPDNRSAYHVMAEELIRETDGLIQAFVMGVGTGGCFSGNAETEDCDGVADCRRQGGRLRANPEEHWVLENFLLDCGAKNPMIRVKQGGKRGAVNTALLRCRIFSTSLRRILSSHLRNVETAVG